MKTLIRKWTVWASLCWILSSSTQAVNLSQEDMQDLKDLQHYASTVKKTSEAVLAKIQEEYPNKTLIQWFDPSDKKLTQLIKLSSDPNSTWPTDIFPVSTRRDQSPNTIEYGLEIGKSYKTDFFLNEISSFMDALKTRKQNGKGLTFKDEIHLREEQAFLNNIGALFANFFTDIPLDKIEKLYQKFWGKFSTLSLLITETYESEKVNESPSIPASIKTKTLQDFKRNLHALEHEGDKHIEPSLKTSTATLEEEFIKAKLFTDAVSYVYETSLNIWGNLAWLHALKYEELGDGSLVGKLPKKSSM